MAQEHEPIAGIELAGQDIHQLLDGLPGSVQPESRAILEKIARLRDPKEEDLDLNMLKSHVTTALSRFGIEPQPVLIITRPLEDLPQEVDYGDVHWAIAVANLRLTIYRNLEGFLSTFRKEFNPERRSKTDRVLASIKDVTSHSNPVFQEIAKDAIGFALVSDSQLIRSGYPQGNPAEPLLDICLSRAIPLGVDQGRFLVATPAPRFLI